MTKKRYQRKTAPVVQDQGRGMDGALPNNASILPGIPCGNKPKRTAVGTPLERTPLTRLQGSTRAFPGRLSWEEVL